MNFDKMMMGLIKVIEIKDLIALNIFLFLFACFTAFGQSPQPDRLYAHLDKPFYVSGEILHFKVYIFNTIKSSSELIHADLINDNGKIIAEQLLKVENNTTHGSLFIPLSQPEGIYFIRIYSAWNLNFNSSFNFVKSIPIYNDFNQSDEVSLESSVTMNRIDKSQFDNIKLEISLVNKNQIHTRESIYLNIRKTKHADGNIKGNISVSVLDLDKCGFGDQNFIHSYYEKQNKLSHSLNEPKYQPEKSILIEGQIVDKDSGKPLTSNVLSVYNTHSYSFSRIESNHGAFSFELPAFTGSTHLQVINMNPFQSKVNRVERKDLSALIPIPTTAVNEMEKSQLVRKYLYYSKLRRKINELYSESSYDSIYLTEPPLLPFTPDRSYLMEKYQLLRNIEDFMREAVSNTAYINEEGKRKILLFNQETKKYFMKSPWFLVDGHFIFDDSITYAIPFNVLNRIDIFNTNKSILQYFDPIMIQGGVVAVYTKNNYLIDYIQSQPNNLSVMGLTPLLNIQFNQSPHLPSSLDETPDLNPLIYWNPDIRLIESGEIQLEILANDVSGYYLIHVEGIDASGRPMSAQKVIEVLP